jgi:hypothetical protein
VVVRFSSVELDSTFDRVRLATTGDADTSSPSLEVLNTRLWVVELLLLVTVGCTSVGTNPDDSTVELATAADVRNDFEESNIVVVEFDDRADSFGFEVDGSKPVVTDVLPFPERLEVKPPVKVVGLDVADPVFDETGTVLAREALGAPEKVSESEEPLARLVDQPLGPPEVSPVVVNV